jgi:hypothetical protein
MITALACVVAVLAWLRPKNPREHLDRYTTRIESVQEGYAACARGWPDEKVPRRVDGLAWRGPVSEAAGNGGGRAGRDWVRSLGPPTLGFVSRIVPTAVAAQPSNREHH